MAAALSFLDPNGRAGTAYTFASIFFWPIAVFFSFWIWVGSQIKIKVKL
jgi:hypothetical protein